MIGASEKLGYSLSILEILKGRWFWEKYGIFAMQQYYPGNVCAYALSLYKLEYLRDYCNLADYILIWFVKYSHFYGIL